MSAGYASRLKDYPNKGKCGLPESFETSRNLQRKLKQLAGWMEGGEDKSSGGSVDDNDDQGNKNQQERNRPYVVILTGAGISTSAGIPDFRGPNGIWTTEQKMKKRKYKKKTPQDVGTGDTKDTVAKAHDGGADDDGGTGDNEKRDDDNDVVTQRKRKRHTQTVTSSSTTSSEIVDFTRAKPTITHRAITKLVSDGVVRYVVTQNVDGLHKRSGISRNSLAVLHGCIFTEKCDTCSTEYFGDEDVGTISFQKTGRKCTECSGGELHDILLDWDDPLPEDDLVMSRKHCKKADLVLCLGTSLRIEPAASLPLDAKRIVICNLQETPYDNHAALIIRERVDKVMTMLMKLLGYDYDDYLAEASSPPIERVWKKKRKND